MQKNADFLKVIVQQGKIFVNIFHHMAASMARNLSTKKVKINSSKSNIAAYFTCMNDHTTIIPLDKKPDVFQ